MDKRRTTNKMAAMALSTLLLAACNLGRPNINGGDTGQPIMDGWTHEMAGEYWLPSVMSDKKPQTAEEVATLSEVNVHINLPVHEGNPMPKDGIIYRQASSEGFISFHLTSIEGDSLNPIGTADMHLREPMYWEQDSLTDVRVRSWGKGIFTAYTIRLQKGRKRATDTSGEAVELLPVIISVYPGGDSLLICRGNMLYDAYIAEP